MEHHLDFQGACAQNSNGYTEYYLFIRWHPASSIQAILKTILGGRHYDPQTQMRTMNLSEVKGLAKFTQLSGRAGDPDLTESKL